MCIADKKLLETHPEITAYKVVFPHRKDIAGTMQYRSPMYSEVWAIGEEKDLKKAKLFYPTTTDKEIVDNMTRANYGYHVLKTYDDAEKWASYWDRRYFRAAGVSGPCPSWVILRCIIPEDAKVVSGKDADTKLDAYAVSKLTPVEVVNTLPIMPRFFPPIFIP